MTTASGAMPSASRRAGLVPEKGQLRLLEAIAALGESARDVHLLLVGGPTDSPYAERIRRTAATAGLASRVSLTGPIDRVQDYYRLCDIVANSRLDPEPFGFSVIETMMLGRPILAHKAGGPGETIIDGVTGWLIQGPGIVDFVAGLQRALADRENWSKIGVAARAHALRRFTSARMTRDLIAIMFPDERSPPHSAHP